MSARAEAAVELAALYAAVRAIPSDVFAVRASVLDALAALPAGLRRSTALHLVETDLLDGRTPDDATVEAAIFAVGLERLLEATSNVEEPADSTRLTLPSLHAESAPGVALEVVDLGFDDAAPFELVSRRDAMPTVHAPSLHAEGGL